MLVKNELNFGFAVCPGCCFQVATLSQDDVPATFALELDQYSSGTSRYGRRTPDSVAAHNFSWLTWESDTHVVIMRRHFCN